MNNIREALVEDISSIVEVHLAALPQDPTTLLGCSFLKDHWYPWLLKTSLIKLVYENENKEIIGFIVLGDQISVLSIFKAMNLFEILFLVRTQLTNLRNFKNALILTLLGVLHPRGLPQLELRWIAVKPLEQNKGIGRELLSCAIGSLKELGVKAIWVKTLKSTPNNILFYQSFGFKIKANRMGRTYLVRQCS